MTKVNVFNDDFLREGGRWTCQMSIPHTLPFCDNGMPTEVDIANTNFVVQVSECCKTSKNLWFQCFFPAPKDVA